MNIEGEFDEFLSVVDNLSLRTVVDIELNADKTRLSITEACDSCFGIRLTKDKVKALINELQVIHDQMND